ncbi:unnamed protein product [Sphagnum jensenii]|uniref:Uncharacterized protein n=1 Tax=Sphagnum jensenii TaxID=128206 RepID=A0ABP0WCF0_9BRYO
MMLCRIRPRYRPDTGMFVVEWRPPLFKKKLSLGTYKKEEDALIACDVCTFHAAEEQEQQLTHEHFNYRCSLKLFATQPPLSMKFSSLKPDCAGELHCKFSDEIRKRTQLWIQHNRRFHWTELPHWVSDENKNASTSQTDGQQDHCQQTSLDLINSFEGNGIPAVLEGNTHDAQFSDKGAENMPEDAPLDHLYEPDWSALPDLDILKKYPELSNQHCNLPSHVTGYNCGDMVSGIKRDTKPVLLRTGTTTHPALPLAMTITANDVVARGGRLAGFELTVLDDMNWHEGGQNLHISSTLDDPFNISEESMEACHMVCWERS